MWRDDTRGSCAIRRAPRKRVQGGPAQQQRPEWGVFARLARPALCAALAALHLLRRTCCTRESCCIALIALHNVRMRNAGANDCAPQQVQCIYRTATSANAKHVALHNVRMRTSSRANVKQSERQAGRTPARAPQRGVANDATRGSSEENGEERHSIRITYYSSCPCLRSSEYSSRVRNGQCSRNGIDAYSSYCNSSNIERPSEYPSRVTANLAFRAWRIMRQRVTLTPAPTRAHAGEKRTARRMRRICDSLSHSRTPYPVV